ncbi:hypothetical protein [Paraburkholderia humisilvae]|uniref:Uncharacterized protein n=1 Tax=Paraburkholderia humisilvae TaxID=627669 RepID=A0A6J5DLG2_9BURK|nr:hypothetical protein [Paraburkholderia humisilvae]CAB3754813.1 hypothetical protein LMG29542_02460 [Paraburkholderia humisilvae]
MKKVASALGPAIAGIALLVLGFLVLGGIVLECFREFGQAAPFAYATVVLAIVLPLGLVLCRRLKADAGAER